MTILIYIVILLFTLLLTIVFYYKKSVSCKFDKSILILYRQSARWAAAAIQDESAIFKVLHANYATGYLWALKDIVSNSQFKEITGQDFLEFESEIVKVQDTATKKLTETCKPLIFAENPILYKAMYAKTEK